MRLRRLFQNKQGLIELIASPPDGINFPAVRLHLGFARAVCSHSESGKRYEMASKRFLQFEQRCNESHAQSSEDAYLRWIVLVLAIDGHHYFQTHPDGHKFRGGKNAAPVIGVIALHPDAFTTTVTQNEMRRRLSAWIAKDNDLAESAIRHLSTKPNSTDPRQPRVQRAGEDPIHMYHVLQSENLESEALTASTKTGSMGFIPHGVTGIHRSKIQA